MSGDDKEGKSAALRLAEEVQRRPLAAAAIAGGAAAAAAGAVMGARALARRNGARKGKPVNPVLAAAITACEAKAACNPEATPVQDGPPVGISD
jgi:H+/Cl- antiporter ClcA